LPEGDLAGFELAKQARERNPSLKVLYTTGETLTDGMKALYVEGASMLPKPYTDVELKEALEAIISGT
jgi:CheY-like chemotaxis protein